MPRILVRSAQVQLKKLQYSFDDLSRCFAVVKQIERVRSIRVIHKGDRQVAGQGLADEAVERVVQTRHLVLPGSRDEQREVAPKIFDRFASAWGHESKLSRGLGHLNRPVEVE